MAKAANILKPWKKSVHKCRQVRQEWRRLRRVDLSDDEAPKFTLPFGMRTVKTVIGVVICMLIGWSFGEVALFAIFSVILCMQTSTDDTIKNGYNRMIATLIGGFSSVGMIALCEGIGLADDSLPYLLLLALMLFPLITFTLYIKKPTITGLTCIVFFAVCLSPIAGQSPLYQAVLRTVDTLLGIVVVMFLELLFPYRPTELSPEIPGQLQIGEWDGK